MFCIKITFSRYLDYGDKDWKDQTRGALKKLNTLVICIMFYFYFSVRNVYIHFRHPHPFLYLLFHNLSLVCLSVISFFASIFYFFSCVLMHSYFFSLLKCLLAMLKKVEKTLRQRLIGYMNMLVQDRTDWVRKTTQIHYLYLLYKCCVYQPNTFCIQI